jgi:Mg-chelatase subunit ChlD
VRVVRASDASECDPLPSVKAALLDGRRPPLAPLDPSYLRRWERSEKPAVTAMVVVDASMSSQTYLSGLGDVLIAVFERFFDPMSRVGLVSVSSSSAEMVFSPTRNRRRVFGRVRDLVPGGHSPLASALTLAERELEKARRAGGARNCFVVLVSDCYPEPLPPGTPDVYASEPYADTRRAARSLGRARMPVIIFDPVNVPMQVMEALPGRRLARYIARATNGILIPVPAEKVKPGGFSVSDLLGAENSRIRKLMDQISNQMEVYRKQQSLSLPGAPVG